VAVFGVCLSSRAGSHPQPPSSWLEEQSLKVPSARWGISPAPCAQPGPSSPLLPTVCGLLCRGQCLGAGQGPGAGRALPGLHTPRGCRNRGEGRPRSAIPAGTGHCSLVHMETKRTGWLLIAIAMPKLICPASFRQKRCGEGQAAAGNGLGADTLSFVCPSYLFCLLYGRRAGCFRSSFITQCALNLVICMAAGTICSLCWPPAVGLTWAYSFAATQAACGEPFARPGRGCSRHCLPEHAAAWRGSRHLYLSEQLSGRAVSEDPFSCVFGGFEYLFPSVLFW